MSDNNEISEVRGIVAGSFSITNGVMKCIRRPGDLPKAPMSPETLAMLQALGAAYDARQNVHCGK
jgi:hypothetical protein